MRRFKRRRKKYTWLPNFGTFVDTGTPDGRQFQNQLEVSIDFANLNTGLHRSTVAIIPMLRDSPAVERSVGNTADELRNQFTFADLIGSEYFLRRIVGKMFVSLSEANPDDVDATVEDGCPFWVKAGIFIARAGDHTGGTGQDPNFPIGYHDNAALYDPFNYEALREPWIFQRSWMLGLGGPFNDSINGSRDRINTMFPCSNVNYGSVMDGPHIDIRTVRRVRQEDRLFFALAAQPVIQLATSQEVVAHVRCYFDYRALGALRRAKQTGNF